MERTQGTFNKRTKRQLYLFGLEEHVILVQDKQWISWDSGGGSQA